MKSYEETIGSLGGHAEVIPRQRRWELMQAWRCVYAAQLHAATGKWTWHGYDWYVFSFGYAQALTGNKARLEYLSLDPPARLIVCPEEEEPMAAFEIVGGTLPDFRGHCFDVRVWPDDLNWTMAFTHEDDTWCGPYFSRREWIEPSRWNRPRAHR